MGSGFFAIGGKKLKFRKLQKIIRYIKMPGDDARERSVMRKAALYVYLVLAGVCVALSVLNIRLHYSMMAVSTVGLAVGLLIAAYLQKRGKVRAAAVIAATMSVIIFSIYAIVGGNNGFAILWIILIPIATMELFGFQIGFLASLYFQIFLVVLFYTPLRGKVALYYSETFMDRFPVLYFAEFSLAVVLMVQKHIVQVRQLNYGQKLQKAVRDEHNRVKDISIQTIMSISNAVDAKDQYTQAHSKRVSEYAKSISKAIGLPNSKVEEITKIALLHDIGKIAVSDNILNKPGRLTKAEFDIMKTHTTAGGVILKDLTILKNVDLGAKFHHERYDGGGYPNGLKGEEIPLEARIIGLADAFDAMNSDRVYRKRLSPTVIHKELVKGSGTQFDPKLVEAFLPIADEMVHYRPKKGA